MNKYPQSIPGGGGRRWNLFACSFLSLASHWKEFIMGKITFSHIQAASSGSSAAVQDADPEVCLSFRARNGRGIQRSGQLFTQEEPAALACLAQWIQHQPAD